MGKKNVYYEDPIFKERIIKDAKGNPVPAFTTREEALKIDEIKNYMNEVAPPVLFEVRTPEIVNVNPTVALPPTEDSHGNRELAVNRIKAYMQILAKPGVSVTAGALRTAIIDGVAITDASVKVSGSSTGIMLTTILQYPYIGEVTWE
jgi:hypothetical protein